jgi:hypothetical protein
METIFLVCAAIGATLIACQFLLGLLGLGGEHDFSHDVGHDVGHDFAHDSAHDSAHDTHHETHGSSSSWIFSWLTLRTVSAAFAFFGLTGLSCRYLQVEDGPTLVIALAAGFSALIERTVGSRGTVYLSIPGNRAGAGKVHVSSQNRLLEYKAITPETALTTGAKVVVVRVISGDTVEVVPAPEPERVSHV